MIESNSKGFEANMTSRQDPALEEELHYIDTLVSEDPYFSSGTSHSAKCVTV